MESLIDYGEFTRRFREDQEIGCGITHTRLNVFFDNSSEVGVWRKDRRTTQGIGEVLNQDNSAMAGYWYGREKSPPNRSPSR